MRNHIAMLAACLMLVGALFPSAAFAAGTMKPAQSGTSQVAPAGSAGGTFSGVQYNPLCIYGD